MQRAELANPGNQSLPRAAVGSESKSIPSLDGIRAVSILIVLTSHAGFGNVIPGGFGVTIFFFLSGYLITTLMLAEHAATGRINIRHFYLRRVLRLMPPLAITLTLAYILAWAGVLPGGMTIKGYLAQLFYLANYYQIYSTGPVPNGTGILWSLAVEEHYYIMYPFLMTILLAKTSRNTIIELFVALCVAVLLWRCVLIFHLGANEDRTYTATDTRIDSIVYGCIFALIVGSDRVAWIVRTPYILYGGACLGILLLLITLIYRDEGFRETFRYSIQGVALMPLFLLAINGRGTALFSLLNSPAMQRIGIYSYTIYLVHFVVIKLLIASDMISASSSAILLTASFVISVAYAALMDTLVDSHFRKLRRRFH